LTDILLFIFSLGEWNGEAKGAIDPGDVAAISIGRFDEVFVLFYVDSFVLGKLAPVLKAGEVL